MSCSKVDCPGKLELVCESDKPQVYLCKDHAKEHQREKTGHTPRLILDEELEKISLETLKRGINSCILEMSKDIEDIITALKNAFNKSIKVLKDEKKSIKSVTEFKAFLFDRERVAFLINEVALISQDIKISTPNRLKELSESLNQTEETLNHTIIQLESSQKELDLKTRALSEFQEEIDNLKKQLDDKNQTLIQKQNTLNIIKLQADEKINNLNQQLKDLEKKIEEKNIETAQMRIEFDKKLMEVKVQANANQQSLLMNQGVRIQTNPPPITPPPSHGLISMNFQNINKNTNKIPDFQQVLNQPPKIGLNQDSQIFNQTLIKDQLSNMYQYQADYLTSYIIFSNELHKEIEAKHKGTIRTIHQIISISHSDNYKASKMYEEFDELVKKYYCDDSPNWIYFDENGVYHNYDQETNSMIDLKYKSYLCELCHPHYENYSKCIETSAQGETYIIELARFGGVHRQKTKNGLIGVVNRKYFHTGDYNTDYLFKWLWEHESRVYLPFDSNTTLFIEMSWQEYLKNNTNSSILIPGPNQRVFIIDFASMSQMNSITKFRRPIKREAIS